MKITRRQLNAIILESLSSGDVVRHQAIKLANAFKGHKAAKDAGSAPELFNMGDLEEFMTSVEYAYQEFIEAERIGSRADESDVPETYIELAERADRGEEFSTGLQTRFMDYLFLEILEKEGLKEAAGEVVRGSGAFDDDVPGYGDLEDPLSPAYAFDVPEELERDTLEPGERFKILSFELDLANFISDAAALSKILGRVKELGGIVMVMPDSSSGLVVEFQSSKDKLLELASYIHNLMGGDSFNAEEFAEYELDTPSSLSPEFR